VQVALEQNERYSSCISTWPLCCVMRGRTQKTAFCHPQRYLFHLSDGIFTRVKELASTSKLDSFARCWYDPRRAGSEWGTGQRHPCPPGWGLVVGLITSPRNNWNISKAQHRGGHGPKTGRNELQDGKGKAVPLQTWTGPESPRALRLPDFQIIGTLTF
jgi:hypothetical protein